MCRHESEKARHKNADTNLRRECAERERDKAESHAPNLIRIVEARDRRPLIGPLGVDIDLANRVHEIQRRSAEREALVRRTRGERGHR